MCLVRRHVAVLARSRCCFPSLIRYGIGVVICKLHIFFRQLQVTASSWQSWYAVYANTCSASTLMEFIFFESADRVFELGPECSRAPTKNCLHNLDDSKKHIALQIREVPRTCHGKFDSAHFNYQYNDLKHTSVWT